MNMPRVHRGPVGLAALIGSIALMLAAVACSNGVSQDEYDRLLRDLAQTQKELASTRGTISELEADLLASRSELSQVQGELDHLKANPPIVEVDLVDIGRVARLTGLKVVREPSANNTYVVTCALDLLGELPGLTNVVDVELYVDHAFADSERWIDISSTGFVTTNSTVRLETGLGELPEKLQLRVVPSFKVFGA